MDGAAAREEIDLAHEASFRLGVFEASPATRELTWPSGEEILQPRVMQVLACLAHARGAVVSRDDLVRRCWGGRIVGEDAINRCIGKVRQIAEIDSNQSFQIETIPRVGYRLRIAGEPPAEAGSAPVSDKPSIAVLPFANLSGDAEQDYFADGMVEEITTALSRVRSIFVVASGSGLSFKGKDAPPQEAARRLGVAYVLEGSVRRAGGRVRIIVRLISGSDGVQIWSDRFEDALEDVFRLQDEVALAVAGRIEPSVQLAEIRRAVAHPTNASGYDLWLRALPLARTYAPANCLKALEFLDQAVALDPGHAAALAFAAWCRYLVCAWGWSDNLEAHRKAGADAARLAVRTAPDDPFVLAHAGLAISRLEHDFAAAVSLLDRAVGLNPGCAVAWLMSGMVRLQRGESDLAIEHVEHSMRLDPLSPDRPGQMIALALANFQKGRFSQAVSFAREGLQAVETPNGHALLAASYGHLGETTLARQALARFRALTPKPDEIYIRTLFSDESHVRLFLDGIGRAEAAPDERQEA